MGEFSLRNFIRIKQLQNMRNKRKTKRFRCYVPVEGKDGGEFESAQTIDFSRGGLGIISEKPIPLKKKIAVELDLDQEQPVFVIGKVQWVQPMDDSDNFRIGLTFESVMRGSKTRLNAFFKGR